MVHRGLQKFAKADGEENHTRAHSQPWGQEMSPGGFIRYDEMSSEKAQVQAPQLNKTGIKGTSSVACREEKGEKAVSAKQGKQLGCNRLWVGEAVSELRGHEGHRDQALSTALT